MKKRTRNCSVNHCSEESYSTGLCRAHFDDQARRKKLRDLAVTVLHTGQIDGAIVADPGLSKDLFQLMDRWRIVCNAVNSGQNADLVPAKHGEFASEWCISLAEQIVEAQRAITGGRAMASSYERIKHEVWERLGEIAQGT